MKTSIKLEVPDNTNINISFSMTWREWQDLLIELEGSSACRRTQKEFTKSIEKSLKIAERAWMETEVS
jgi:hypothetical protein